MSTNKIIYYVSTAILTGVMLFSAQMYFFKYEAVAGFFTTMGFPTWIVYPLAIFKLLGLVAIWTRISPVLKDLAYAGFFYNTLLAFFAHYMHNGGGFTFAIVAFFAVVVSYAMQRKIWDLGEG